MKKYTYEWDSLHGIIAVDATKYVLSGEYYFDCEYAFLVSRVSKKFPLAELRRTGKVEIKHYSDKNYEEFLKAELIKPNFFEGFNYRHTYIIKDEDPSILCDNYQKIIRYNGQLLSIIISDFRGRFYTIGIKELNIDPANKVDISYWSYEQLREKARTSCPYSQD